MIKNLNNNHKYIALGFRLNKHKLKCYLMFSDSDIAANSIDIGYIPDVFDWGSMKPFGQVEGESMMVDWNEFNDTLFLKNTTTAYNMAGEYHMK